MSNNVITLKWNENNAIRGNSPSTTINSSDATEKAFVKITDKNKNSLSYLRNVITNTGATRTELVNFNTKNDGSNVINIFSIGCNKDGSKTYSVTDPVAFRQALNVIIKEKTVTTSSFTIPNKGEGLLIPITIPTISGYKPISWTLLMGHPAQYTANLSCDPGQTSGYISLMTYNKVGTTSSCTIHFFYIPSSLITT